MNRQGNVGKKKKTVKFRTEDLPIFPEKTGGFRYPEL